MVNTRRIGPRVGLLSLGPLVAVLFCGCGDSGPPRAPLHPTSGTVIVDGQPAAGVQVRFRPAANPNALDALVPFGATDEDGVYTLGTYEPGDGAPAGRYKVTLFWSDRPPGPQPGEDQLGGVYTLADRTTLEATVGEGEQTIPPFEVARSKTAPTRKRPSVDNDGLQ